MVQRRLFLSISLVFTAFALLPAQESYNSLVYEGNGRFGKKNYDDASSKYLGAIKINDKDFTAHYNLGNALYKRKLYKEATAEYQKAETLAKNNSDRAAAIYNQGNVQMQTKNSEKAAELYKRSLKTDPYNEAVRKNYEIAMLKEKEKQNQQQKNQNKSGKGGDDKDKGKGDNKDGKNPQQQSGGSQQNQQGQGQGSDGAPKQDQNNGSTMPKNEQNAILNRIGNKERETAKRILNKNAYSTPESNQKDW